METQFADLHIHSSFSDGFFTPKEIVNKANEKKLSCIAVTDHDCVDAIPHLFRYASSLEVIPAVELTTELDDKEIHILGYFIDHQEESFVNRLKEFCRAREKRIYRMVEKLNAFGINIDYKEVVTEKREGSVGRLHLAQVLLKRGYVRSISEAFSRYIGNHAPCYVQRFRLLPHEAIRMVKEVGGVTVLAHPYKMNKDELIEKLVKEGIEGIEVYHPDQSSLITEHYLYLARRYSLLVTGGSDCHGIKGKRELGSIKISYEWVKEMKERIKER
ncbi:MAG: PHP domain-containing protein [Candidatus Omnitrophica bacterium]|nr:PHP domain-containing protein [Candidatus Omnitrophota bacterium]